MMDFETRVGPARPATAEPEPESDLAAPGPRRDRDAGIRAFRAVRAETERRAAPLSPEDQQVQSMPDASPTKWHRAHTTWFFEQFLLRPNRPDYRGFDERFAFLFNSYYVQAGPRHARPQRGLVTRPTCDEVAAYRAHVDAAVEALVAEVPAGRLEGVLEILEIGLHHEQQHQELILTDALHAFSLNPTLPAYDPAWRPPAAAVAGGDVALPRHVARIGHDGRGFAFDNEGPRHEVLIPEVAVGAGLVTNADWLAFIEAGGYARADLWLSDGFARARAEGWEAPGYWRRTDEDGWARMTLAGLRPVDPTEPVCHVSYYEADAFARFAGRDLPSEAEWEVAATRGGLADAHGHVWQWTRSAYLAYPGFRAAEGALGEYNGKFMINTMVLRGSSLATPDGHARATYRNFFAPGMRWQFTGLRLAAFPR